MKNPVNFDQIKTLSVKENLELIDKIWHSIEAIDIEYELNERNILYPVDQDENTDLVELLESRLNDMRESKVKILSMSEADQHIETYLSTLKSGQSNE